MAGLFDFVKSVGKKLFGQADDPAAKIKEMTGREATHRDVLSYLLYPKVYEEFVNHQKKYGDTSILPTPVFFYGQEVGEEIGVDIENAEFHYFLRREIGETFAL